MAGRIVVFGATGYTGELVARALVAQGARPVLAGRSARRLERLAAELGGELGGLETAVAEADRPRTVRQLVDRGDVLISTVGPFDRWGDPAVEAAIGAGATYLDSSAEQRFIRRVFEHFGPPAAAAECGLLTAFGFEWAPGHLAGALALREAGPDAVRVDIGYFPHGGGKSRGTRASLKGFMLEPSFGFRGGRLRSERTGARMRAFDIGCSTPRYGASVGGSEHFGLPAAHPELRDIDVILGSFGALSRAMPLLSVGIAAAARIRPVKAGLAAILDRQAAGPFVGPDATARERNGTTVVAEAFSSAGHLLARATLRGVNGYTFTANFLAWGAMTAARHGVQGVGALTPLAAFGLDALHSGVTEAGLTRAEDHRR
ncbi:trans-acting enoyl reductase family protein [Streptomyces sp. XD-27]|uniref:saccharopine dehydrogenase family protein n=1 Tax=Streptomyces sp. XD-27 TaxID=3062779 RepID=UPI0026F40EDD|nr:saccharopine dehydrogenase NADP-binding domain-containing protein [Streptomyces sp. XD-27]WKX73580.1 saccharopine dehydrogenase NADP-binding domain-containing protein [Streptomyces sp. XD-27]